MKIHKKIPIKRLADGRMAMQIVHEYPVVYEADSNMYILASRLKEGKHKLTNPSNDSDDDTAGMEYIQDMLDNF